MRELSPEFMDDLLQGKLSPLLNEVRIDKDLILEIRENYLDVYFKGNRLLNLKRQGEGYKASSFDGICDLKINSTEKTEDFVEKIPLIKQKIIHRVTKGNELEFEQMLIRSNNYESRLNTDYYIADRQFVLPGEKDNRIDMFGVYWPRRNRAKGREVNLALIEIKYGEKDIKGLPEQLEKYYNFLNSHLKEIIDQTEVILRQKLDLGLFMDETNRLKAMREFKILRELKNVRFVIILIDCNPDSTLLSEAIKSFKELPFANLINIFHVGFGLWDKNKIEI